MGFFRGKKRSGGMGFGRLLLCRHSILPADKILAQRGSPSDREEERAEKRDGHGDGKGAEETAGNAGGGNERQENDEGSDGGADERNSNFAESALNGLETRFARVAM